MSATSTQSTATHVLLLGAPQLRLADGSTHALERKDAALLALLTLEGAMPRARAASLLWPEVDEEAARNNLRQRLHRLRKRAGCDLVSSAHDVLRLADHVTHDIGPPARGTTSADGAAMDGLPVSGGETGEPGELLGSLDYGDCADLHEWVAAARERQRAIRRDLLAETAARLEREGHLALALRYAEQLVATDPLLEHAHRRLMRLHYLRGDRAAALSAFARCRETLARELGAVPGDETTRLAALVEASGVLPKPVVPPKPVALLRPPRLVGREVPWRELERVWSERALALVSGEPGIGKSRLLADFASAHGDAIMVGGRPGDAQVPYALLARLLRALRARSGTPMEQWALRELTRVVPEFDPAWSPVGDINRARLAQAVHLLLAAAASAEPGVASASLRPHGIVIDDLQFADAESIELLGAVVRDDEREFAWVMGARSHELSSVTANWLASKAAVLTRIDLAPLQLAETRALLETLGLAGFDAARWVDVVYRHTGGNPMFVLETMLALQGPKAGGPATGEAPFDAGTLPPRLPIPASVGQLIEARLAQMSPGALRVARVAVLADKDFDLQLAADVLQLHVLDLADPWAELEHAQVMRDGRFAHDLIYEATQRSVPAAVAALIHESIAACLEKRGAAAERIALHWYLAQAWSKAASAYLRAAEHALEHSRRAEELALLRRAAECLQRAGRAEGRFQIELRSARAALLIDRTDQAHRFALDALPLAPDAAGRAEALAVVAEAEDFMNEGDSAIEHAEEGLSLAVQLGAPPLVLALAALLGRLRAVRGDFDRAVAEFDRHEPWLERCSGDVAARMFLAHRAVVLDQARRRDEAVAVGTRALALATQARDWSTACLCNANLGSFHLRIGTLEQAVSHLRQALRLGDQLGEAGGKTELARIYLGDGLSKLGRYRESLDALTMAHTRLTLGKALPWASIALNILARVYMLLGQPARGWKLIEETPPDLPAAVLALRYINQARVLRALGRPRGRLIESAFELFERQKQHETDLLAHLEHAIDSEPAHGAQIAVNVEAQALQRMHGPLLVDAQAIGCMCLFKAGDVKAAAAKARALLGSASRLSTWTLYPGSIFWHAFEALDAEGDTETALDALSNGVAWINAVLPDLPDEFSASFRERDPINRAILTTATRRLR